MKPSLIASAVSGFILLIATIILILQYKTLSRENIIIILLLLSIAYSAHAICHYLGERIYNFNPLENKWNF